MKINVGGVWKDTKPHVNVGGVWKPVSTGWVNVGGVWKKMYTSEFVYEISGAQTNFNLYNAIGLTDSDTIRVVIKPGTTFRASSSGIPAFNVGNAYNGKQIIIENNGSILGKGGTGGNGGGANDSTAYGGSPGGAGGTALYVRTQLPIQLHNNGHIGGGGGGGGGGAGILIDHRVGLQGSIWHQPTHGGRGGNGADGVGGGAGGAAGGYYSKGLGKWVRGGNGGTGGAAGAGGASGGSGTTNIGTNISAKRVIPGGGPGGRAGYAIDGNSHVQLLTVGSVAGPRVN